VVAVGVVCGGCVCVVVVVDICDICVSGYACCDVGVDVGCGVGVVYVAVITNAGVVVW